MLSFNILSGRLYTNLLVDILCFMCYFQVGNSATYEASAEDPTEDRVDYPVDYPV